MKITAIHAAATSGPKNVTFHVDGHLNPSALSRMRLEGLWLGAQAELLTVDSAEPITPTTIERICARYAEVDAQLAEEEGAEKAKRQAMLDQVVSSTGLPLGPVAT